MLRAVIVLVFALSLPPHLNAADALAGIPESGPTPVFPGAGDLRPTRAWIPGSFEDELARNPHVREMLETLWRQTRFGTSCEERAAWIIREADGGYSCLQVQPTHACNEISFPPLRPFHAVALVHTHPNRSAGARETDVGDHLAARRIGLPLYTLHRDGLWKYDPKSAVTTKELGPLEWQHGMARDHCRCPLAGPNTQLARERNGESSSVVIVQNAP